MPQRTGQGSRITVIAATVLVCAWTAGAATAALAATPSGSPVEVSSPILKGTPSDGKRLKATRGLWSGAKPIAYSFQWQRCSANGDQCTSLSAAKGASYQLTSEDVGHTIRALLTASNAQGSATATTLPSSQVSAVAPRRRKSASVSGSAQDGQVLTVTGGTWKGSRPISFSYQWQSCRMGSCAVIAGATGSSYRATSAQLGEKLRVIVTAANGAGSSSGASKTSTKVIAGPPVSLQAPTIAGTVLVGQTVSAEVGLWGGTGPFEYSYQWRTCNVLAECTDVAGANGATYTVSPLDVASSLQVLVTAANGLGSSSASSAPTNAVSAVLPSNTGLPSIAGLLQDGGVLSALTGSWSGSEPLEFSYGWEQCDAAGAACEAVSGALGSTLGLLAGEVGSTIRVVVTATNGAGSTSATSEATSAVKALPPSSISLPAVSGLLQDGGLLSGTSGSWSGTAPLSYAYQWQLCNASGAGCKDIAEAAASTLGVTAGEIGSTLRLLVTATNAAGSTSAISEATSIVKALPPSNTVLPSISGLLQTGQLLSVLKGSWSGSQPLTYAYQWQLCSALGGGCTSISKATEPTFKLALADIGLTLRVIVTATNGAGSTSATSAVTGLISGLL